MTTVNISGTYAEKQRPNNGLERVAEYMHKNRLARIPVVGYVEFHQYTERITGNALTVAIPAIEPALDADGTDPSGAAEQLWQILDQLRRQNGKGSVAETLFSTGVPPAEGQLDGQVAFDFDRVPEPSGEELTAELDERRAARAQVADPFAGRGDSDV